MRRFLIPFIFTLLVFAPVDAATILRQSTSIDVRVGPFVDAADAVTPETGITLGAADQAELLKADGAATVNISGRTFAAVTGSDGWYDLTLTTTDTNTIGELVVVVQDSSVALPVFVRLQVIEESAYDNMYASGAVGPITSASVNSQVVDVVGTDTVTLPGQTAPPASPTINQILGWLYKVLRNKADQTATEWQLYDDAGSTVDAQRSVGDDGTTTTINEITSGP